MSTEELIERGEQRLKDLAKVREIIGEEPTGSKSITN